MRNDGEGFDTRKAVFVRSAVFAAGEIYGSIRNPGGAMPRPRSGHPDSCSKDLGRKVKQLGKSDCVSSPPPGYKYLTVVEKSSRMACSRLL